MKPATLTCSDCGAPMVLRTTYKYFYKNGEPRKFWGCSRWPECEATHGAHPDGSPLGIPANKETKQWRIKAHESFDSWSELMGLSRSAAYDKLSENFGVSEIHIAELNIEGCKEVIRFCGDPVE